MTYINSSIINNIPISPELFILQLHFPYPIEAGQFVMLVISDHSHILPRPISVFDYDLEINQLSLLIRKRGIGSELLSQLEKGDSLELFGGLGKGFNTIHENKKIVLIGGGEGIAPMLLTSNLLKEKNNITIFSGFRYDIESSILEYFDQDLSIEYTALDHSEQYSRGLVTNLLDTIEEPDYIYACGPLPMMKAIHQIIHTKQWKTQYYVSMESHMACGVGACMGCTIKNNQGNPLKVCTEGPVFPAKEIFHV